MAVGITQIIGWGTTVYALGVLARPIAADTGWSRGVVFGGLTVALLVSALTSMPVGRWLDREGGRRIMTLGSLVAAAGLAALTVTGHPLLYLAVWGIVGLAMRMILYDAAFASLVQLAPARGRRAISILTLFGGLASSVMWPVGAALESAYGWRTTLLVYAALNLLVCVPLHWIGLARDAHDTSVAAQPAVAASGAVLAAQPLLGEQRRWAMVMFAIVISASALVTGSIAVQMVDVLAVTGIDAGWAVALAAAQGVTQTLARLVDLVFGRALHAMSLARLTIALLPLALLVLISGQPGWGTAVGFVVLFGAANGLATIVRAAVPLALFGAKGYGEVLGRIALPVQMVTALAPALFALAAERVGNGAALQILAVAAILAWAGMEAMALWWRRIQAT